MYVRWGMGTTDSSWHYSGWNLDDVVVSGVRLATPGVTVTPTSGLATTEAGGTATFSVVLDAARRADVTIGLRPATRAKGRLPRPA